MLKKVGLFCSLLLAMPAFASAWTISARVASGTGNVQAVEGVNLLPAPGYASVANTVASQDLIVVPAANNAISRVLVDGVVATPVSDGVYKVNYNSKSSHTLTAYFAATAASKFTVNSLQDLKAVGGTNGTFTIQQVAPALSAPTTGDLTNVVAGSKIKVVAIPRAGFTVSSILVNGNPVAAVASGAALIANNITVNANTTVSAVYAELPVVTIPEAVFPFTSPFTPSPIYDTASLTNRITLTVQANGNAAAGALTYAFSIKDSAGAPAKLSDGTTIVDAVDATTPAYGMVVVGNKATFGYKKVGYTEYHMTAGNYKAVVTVTGANGGSATKAFPFTVQPKENVVVACTGCHSNSTPAIVTAWTATKHAESDGHDSAKCFRCHNGKGPLYAETNAYTGDVTTLMATNGGLGTDTPAGLPVQIGCVTCHTDNGHLGALRPVSGWDPNGNSKVDQFDVCTACHTLQNTAGKLEHFHTAQSVRDGIISDTHYDNPATNNVEGYVVRIGNDKACAECHDVHQAETQGTEASIQQQWARSGHAGKVLAIKEALKKADGITALDMRNAADLTTRSNGATTDATAPAWVHYSWEGADRQACQRCHTATGAANYLSNRATYNAANNDFSHLKQIAAGADPVANPATSQNEVLYCWGCHSNAGTGELRNPGALTLDYSTADGDTVVYADVKQSNVCIACHSGNGGSGDSIANQPGTVNFANLAAIQPHYLATAGTLMTESGNGGTGYEFVGVTYTKNGKHQKVGVNGFYGTGTEGPCVSCHMSGAEKHSFEASAASPVCVNCHTGLTDAAIEEAKVRYTASLEALNVALKAKGIFFVPSYPYFVYDSGFGGGVAGDGIIQTVEINRDNGIKNWTTQVVGGNAKDTMGAAFNYNLLVHERGVFAHNKAYAYELIQTSIDYLADGLVNGTGVNPIVAAAAASKEFAEATSHPAAILASPSTNCAACHAPAPVPAPHYGGAPFHKAQYVSDASLPVTCAACHSETANQAILVQFAGSAHADPAGEAWLHFDWRGANRSACARCHNGSAFVAKLGSENNISGVFQPSDILKPGEILACSACHSNVGTGELRTPSEAFTINMTNSTVDYDVVGASGLCVRCHSGRETGASIKADNDVTGVRVFVDSHYQPAAGTLYNKSGYDYGDNATLVGHKTLGALSNGPCVSCHMAGKDHSFAAAGCVTCHNGPTALVTDAATMKANYDTALNNLKLALAAKGIHYGPVHPYFFTTAYVAGGSNAPVTNWGSAYGAANWKHTMGAAFNYNLFWSEKGAYAHDYKYAMKLIADSIDFMSDGVFNGP